MARIGVNGIELEYEVRGEGEPLLLIMGLSGQLITWPEGFVDQLVQRGFQVIRFDNRDSGLSTHFDTPPPTIRQLLAGVLLNRPIPAAYALADLAGDAAGLLDALGLDSAHVVGASMGGMVAQELAVRHPHRVRSLTSIMSNTGDRRHGRISLTLVPVWIRLRRKVRRDPIDAGIELWRRIGGPAFDQAEARDLVERSYARSHDPDSVGRQSAAILACPDRTPSLRHVKVPTLVVHGLADKLVLPSGGAATARAIPGSRLLMFPDMAHDLPRNRWPELADAIRATASRSELATR
jgi:pimeloyl-ACP methyl ester carboxylesterase